MTDALSRMFRFNPPSIPPGLYPYQTMLKDETPLRLHLRVEPTGTSILLVNASTVLHLNETATAHAYGYVKGKSERSAANLVAQRYRVPLAESLEDQRRLRDQVEALVSAPDLDPVTYLDMEQGQLSVSPSTAPYRLDLALTYATDPTGKFDSTAASRVERELTTLEWQAILDKAWRAGVPHVTFTGGEPCRRLDLADLISQAERLGQVTGVLTAGMRLADPAYLDSLAQAGLDHLLITWLPDDPASTLGLQNAAASDIFTTAHLTLAPDNTAALPGWIESLARFKVNAVSFSSRHPKRSQAILQEAADRAAFSGLDLVWDLPVPYTDNNPIDLEVAASSRPNPLGWLYVEPDGDVLLYPGAATGLGNIGRDRWETIWSQAQKSII
jgi:hypothetical protein